MIFVFSRTLGELTRSSDQKRVINFESKLDKMDKKIPGMKEMTRDYIGVDDWINIEDPNRGIKRSIGLPSIQEIIDEYNKNY
jgi:hypothetical protein